MPYSFGKRSLSQLMTVQNLLQEVFYAALETGLIDISIIEGRRDRATQDLYFKTGKSRVKWPHGKHNVQNPEDKARAVDAAPFINGRISWNKSHCIFLAGIVLTIAKQKGIPLRWGGNWDLDGEPITDQDFQDLVHYELIR